MIMLMVRLALAVLLVVSIAGAQSRRPAAKPKAGAPAKTIPADLTQKMPIRSLVIRGLQNFESTEVLKLSGLAVDMQVNKADVDRAQQRLLDTGLFARVDYRIAAMPPKGYEVVFEVQEVDQFFPFRFEAIEADEKEMRAHLKQHEPLFGAQIPATEPVLKRISAALTEYLASKGRPMNVIGRLLPGNGGKMEVVFQPSSLPAVAEVRFTGNKTIAGPPLQLAMAGAGIGALYTEPRFRQILDAGVRPLFEAEGLLRVSFPRIETAPASDVKGLIVTVHVDEGAVYKLKDVALAGPMADDKALLKRGGFKTGEIANMTAVQAGVDQMKRSLRRSGFLKVDAAIDRKLDDKAKAVDVTVNVDPGPQYRMGQLLIEGLDVETEPHIRKLWALQQRQPFDNEYPDLFLSKMPEYLDNLGTTRAVVKPDDGTHTVDVTLRFEGEKKPPKPGTEPR
jgi:outer membrane protein assembly factor BamA